MKFIFSFLFSVIFLLPVLAANQCQTLGESQCKEQGGCIWNTEYSSGSCEACDRESFSAPNDESCNLCAIRDTYTNEWSWNITTAPTHSIFDYDNATEGQSECPWKCDAGYYKNNDGTACVACPDGNTDVTDSEPQQNISQCPSCPGNKHLIRTTFTNNNNETIYRYFCGYCYDQTTDSVSGLVNTSGGITTCNCGVINANANYSSSSPICACPNGATFNSTTKKCECPSGYMDTSTNTCQPCPPNSGNNGAAIYDINDCVCNAGYPNRNEENNILVSCTACGADAEYHNGTCMCKPNYYGDGQTCTQCPPGTGINDYNGYSQSPTTIANCQMSSTTKFCTGSGDNKKCMLLLDGVSNSDIQQPSNNN